MINPYFDIEWLGRDASADREILRVPRRVFDDMKAISVGLVEVPNGSLVDFTGIRVLLNLIARLSPEDMCDLYAYIKGICEERSGDALTTTLDGLLVKKQKS